MTKLLWDQIGERRYETGIDKGVLYLDNGVGVAWNGLTSVDQSFADDVANPYYLDGVKYLDSAVTGDYEATIKALTYPDEFLEYEGVTEIVGSGLYANYQSPKMFNLSYRTLIGNDVTPNLGYKLHILYNLIASPETQQYTSMTSKTSGMEFSWKLTSIPEEAPGYRPTAHVVIDSRYMDPILMSVLEEVLYGTDNASASIPELSEILGMVTTGHIITVVDNGDGTWTATTLNDYIIMTDPTTFIITDIDATYFDDHTYSISTTDTPMGP